MNPLTNTLTPLTPISTTTANSTVPYILPTPPVMEAPKTSGAVLTSDTPRTNVTAANTYLNNTNAAAQSRVGASAILPTAPGTTEKKTSTDIYKTVSSIGADLSDAKLSKKAAKGLSGAEKAQALYQKQVKKIQGQLTALQANMDARTATEIENIKKEYEILTQEQEQANFQYESGVTTAGFRSGLNQYASQIQGNILHNAMSQGIQKLSKLQQERSKLINQAEAARDERNYKLLTTKMEMLRQNHKDQQDSVYRLREELRATNDATRKDIEFKTTSVAPQLSKLLTGDEARDTETIQTAANQMGVPVSTLYQALDKYKMDTEKALPASIQEYKAALRTGIIPQGTSYASWKAIDSARGGRTAGGSLLTTRDAISLGAPSLAGYTEGEVALSMVDSLGKFKDTPPAWFVDMIERNSLQNFDTPKINAAWKEFVSKPTVQKFITGSKESSTDSIDTLIDAALSNQATTTPAK